VVGDSKNGSEVYSSKVEGSFPLLPLNKAFFLRNVNDSKMKEFEICGNKKKEDDWHASSV